MGLHLISWWTLTKYLHHCYLSRSWTTSLCPSLLVDSQIIQNFAASIPSRVYPVLVDPYLLFKQYLNVKIFICVAGSLLSVSSQQYFGISVLFLPVWIVSPPPHFNHVIIDNQASSSEILCLEFPPPPKSLGIFLFLGLSLKPTALIKHLIF